MNEEAVLIEEKARKRRILRKILKPKVIIAIIVIIALCVLGYDLRANFHTDGETTKLGFEDIGELATQTANCTSVRVEEKDRDLFGVTIPFTQTKYIYTYNTEIKAGIDFSDVKVTESNDDSKIINVEIPEIRILSTEIDYDSFKLYHEEESIFSPISMEEHNESMEELEETAQEDAIDNGLYENAYENAKTILTSFLEQVYDTEEYEIQFSEQK